MTSRTPSTLGRLPLGRRIAYWRSRRNLSQQLFADRLGKSKSWVEKVERGARRLDKVSVLHEIADVLGLDLHLLTDDADDRRDEAATAPGVDVGELRAALERYVSVSWYLNGKASPPQLPELRRAIGHAWLAFQHARYESLTRGLPKLIGAAQSADAHDFGCAGTSASAHLLSQVYQVASSTLCKLGEPELAWLAADRATAVAVRADDRLLAGVATARAADALLALGRARAALDAYVSGAYQLAPTEDGGPPDPARSSVHGHLLLLGAVAAAQLGDRATVEDLFEGADKAATAFGSDQNHYWTNFGPTSLHLHRVAAAVALGDGKTALRLSRSMSSVALNALPPERRAAHLLDLARAYAQARDARGAGAVLIEAERLAPEEIRHRPTVRALVTEVLLLDQGEPASPVAELARRAGVRA